MSTSPLPPLAAPLQRVGVFRALHLGDLLCAVPALRALRAALPQAHITLIGLPWAQGFVERYAAYVDELLVYPCGEPLPGAGAGTPEFAHFLERAQARHFDLVLQLHGSGEASNALVARLGAAQTAGFHPPRTPAPGPWYLPWQADEPEVLRWLRLLRHAGAAVGDDARARALEFPLREADRRETAQLLRQAGLVRGRYVCVHPGAKLRSRRWPVERFAAVAQQLLERGHALALTGSEGEAALTAEIAARLRPPLGVRVADLAGRTSLGSLAGLVTHAQLVVCNDTGLSHVAAALRTPSVVVACGSDARRWAPLDAQRHVVLAQALPCRPCAHDECPVGHGCAWGMAPEPVLAAAQRLLQPAAGGVRHAA